MKKFAVFTVLLSLSLLLVASAAAQTRPRRAPDATPAGGVNSQKPATNGATTTQQTVPDDAGPATEPSGAPPVMKGSDGRPVGAPPVSPADGAGAAKEPAAPAGPEDVDENDVIKVDTALVTLPVSVTDRDGKYVGNLKQKDFRIFEDGVEQNVAYFQPVEKPFTVALLMDMSGSTKDHLREIQDAAFAFVEQLRPDDRVMIVSFDDDVHVLCEPTSDHRALRSAIQSARSGDGTSLYEAVDFVLNKRFNKIDGRKAIVLFTDGVDTTSRRASYQSNVLDAEEDGALVYVVQYDTFNEMNAGGRRGAGMPPSSSQRPTLAGTIGTILTGGNSNVYGRQRRNNGGGAGTSEEDYRRADAYLHDIADKSGARVERASSIADLDQSFANIADELRRQYSLGYYPKTASNQGQRHAVRVQVMRPNLAVRARNSYITGDPNGPKTQPQPGKLAGTATAGDTK